MEAAYFCIRSLSDAGLPFCDPTLLEARLSALTT